MHQQTFQFYCNIQSSSFDRPIHKQRKIFKWNTIYYSYTRNFKQGYNRMSSTLLRCLLFVYLFTVVTSVACKCCCQSTSTTQGTCSSSSMTSCSTCTNSWCQTYYTCSITGSSSLTAYDALVIFAIVNLVYFFQFQNLHSSIAEPFIYGYSRYFHINILHERIIKQNFIHGVK